MAKNFRTKLSPRNQSALETFAKKVPAGAEADPNNFDVVENKFQEQEAKEPEAKEPEAKEPEAKEPEAKEPEVKEPEVQEPEQDWVDTLTFDEPVEPPTEQTTEQTTVQTTEPATQEQPLQQADESDDEYVARLREQFEELEHIDASVANELFDKTISPIIERKDAQHRREMEALKAKLAVLEQSTTAIQQERASKQLADVNAPIFSKYPKADKILKSKEFAEWINANQDPYSPVSNLQILGRAYQAGDSNRVIEALDKFAESRGKPKPPVNADGKGSSSTPAANKPNQRMTQAEFLAERRAIMANPRKYPKGALRKLELDFFS